MIYKYDHTEIFSPKDRAMSDNDRVLVKTIDGHWFLVKRAGQRSWVAVAVAEGGSMPDYQNVATHDVDGNSKNIMQRLDNALTIESAYYVYSNKQYRMAMISIMATGHIATKIEVNMVA